MKKFVSALLILALLIILISFSPVSVSAAETDTDSHNTTPQTGDHVEIVASVILLIASGIVILVGYQHESKHLF